MAPADSGKLYDSSDGITYTGLRIASTIIPMVLEGWEFWFFFFFNIGIFAARKSGHFHPEDFSMNLPWGLTGVTGSLMTFFVVFYNNHVFTRYNKLHDLTKRMSEDCLELISMIKNLIPSKHIQRKVSKLILASCFMFFFERTEQQKDEEKTKEEKDEKEGKEKDYSPGRTAVSWKEFQQLERLDFLTRAEIEHLMKYCERLGRNSIPSFMVLQWAIETVLKTTPNPLDNGDMLFCIYGKCYNVRSNQAEVVQMMDFPMPFQYFHVMNLMLLLNLFLWGYSLGCQDSFFAPLIFTFLQLMFQGIRFLSTALSDPFGDDEVDFPVNDWMIQMYSRMHGILEDNWDVMDRTKTNYDTQPPMTDISFVQRTVDMNIDLKDDKQQNGKESDCHSDGSV